MRILKGVLKEELANSKRIKRQYEQAIRKLPKGSLHEKEIRGHKYFYLVLRESGRVRLKYVGRKKSVSADEIKKYAEAKKMRAEYRKLLSETNKQVSFLQRILNEKELRSLTVFKVK